MKRMYVLPLAMLLVFMGCDTPTDTSENDALNNDEIKFRASEEPEDLASNNLSFPVIWADNVAKMLPGSPGMAPVFTGSWFINGSDTLFVQGDPGNLWQADTYSPSGSESPIEVSTIDWGDNLEAKSWPAGAVLRVETVLYKTLSELNRPFSSMTGYVMYKLDEDVTGPNEMWGTRGETYESETATIYSNSAYLVIQRLTAPREEVPTGALLWNADDHLWINATDEPFIEETAVFDGGVWNAVDGPGGYSAEVNVQGKVIYGYNWDTNVNANGPGDYRITFALIENREMQGNEFFGTVINGSTTILEPIEEVVILAEPDKLGGVAVMDPVNNLTYIDIRLDPKGSGRGANGGNGGSGGHYGGGNGGHYGGNW